MTSRNTNNDLFGPIGGAVVDLNTTVSNQSTIVYGGGAPVAAPVTCDAGDVHIEVYSDVIAYFTATAIDTWPAVAQTTVDQSAQLFKGSLNSSAALTALAKASLVSGDTYAIGSDIYIWRPTASIGAYQPSDTAFPGGVAQGGNGLVGSGSGAGGGGATSGGTGSVAGTGGNGVAGRLVVTEYF